MSNQKELHLMIIWHRGMGMKDRILEDLQKKFQIANVYEISWDKKNFAKNISRFYGKKLQDIHRKVRECGEGSFLLITFLDNSPEYGVRQTTSGLQRVNANIFDLKKCYREMDSVPFSIHATNDPMETKRDIFLLLGAVYEDYLRDSRRWSGEITVIKADTYALTGFSGLKELFQLLNQCTRYVVLRNYDNLPKSYVVGSHGDIDLLVESLDDAVGLLGAKREEEAEYRVRYSVSVDGERIYFDLRSVGDGYYDESFQKEILNGRTFNEKGFYVPSVDSHLYALLYHALIHKKDVSTDYKAKLDAALAGVGNSQRITHEEMCSALDRFIVKNGYGYPVPSDKSVYFNESNINSKELISRPEVKKMTVADFVEVTIKPNRIQLYLFQGCLNRSIFRFYISIGGIFRLDLSIGRLKGL